MLGETPIVLLRQSDKKDHSLTTWSIVKICYDRFATIAIICCKVLQNCGIHWEKKSFRFILRKIVIRHGILQMLFMTDEFLLISWIVPLIK